MILTEPSNFFSNDSQIITTDTEVLKHTVKFNMPEKMILNIMIPNVFCPGQLTIRNLHTEKYVKLLVQWETNLKWGLYVFFIIIINIIVNSKAP